MESHASAILSEMTPEPRTGKGTRGPKGGFENPHPTRDADTAWLSPQMLHATWRRLQEGFKTPAAQDLLRTMPVQPPPDYVRRVVALAQDVFRDAHDPTHDEPVIWSALVRAFPTGEPPPGLAESDREFWFEYRQPSELRTTVDLEPTIADALSPEQRGRMGKSGLAGYLASAVLAAHLGDATPEQVQRAVEHYRRKHGE